MPVKIDWTIQWRIQDLLKRVGAKWPGVWGPLWDPQWAPGSSRVFCRSYILIYIFLNFNITKATLGPPLNPPVPFRRKIEGSFSFILILWTVNLVIMNLTYQKICSSKNNHMFLLRIYKSNWTSNQQQQQVFFIREYCLSNTCPLPATLL